MLSLTPRPAGFYHARDVYNIAPRRAFGVSLLHFNAPRPFKTIDYNKKCLYLNDIYATATYHARPAGYKLIAGRCCRRRISHILPRCAGFFCLAGVALTVAPRGSLASLLLRRLYACPASLTWRASVLLLIAVY